MTLKDFWKREKHVALHAQSCNFRIAKWMVIVVIAGLIYMWKGIVVVVLLFLFLGIVGAGLHFFLRWKTEAWTKSWGPYKRIPLNGE